MNGRCLSLVVVCFVSVLHVSAAARSWTSAENDTFCFWTSGISNGQTHYMFLYQTPLGKESSFVLFDSIWDKKNSPVACITSNNHLVIKSFLSKCWKARDRPFPDIPDERFNISMLVEPDGLCVAAGHLPELRAPMRRSRDAESTERRTVYQNRGGIPEAQKRSKRAWMIPGTLWCGSGNKASNFTDLGLFEETDKCCREHDHCEQTIASFEFSYGVFNTNFFTLSHCDCDSKFRRCLRDANDRMADMVGYGYFNVLKMRCFELSQRVECAERTWWGMCKHSKMTMYALLREATDFNSTVSGSGDDKLNLTTYHTVSFGDLTVTNDLLMSSDIVTKDTSQKHSSVSWPQWLSVTVNKSQQPELHGKTLTTHVTESSDTEPSHTSTDSPPIITDLERRQTPDLSISEITDSPVTQTHSYMSLTTNAANSEITDSLTRETTDSSNLETTEATDSLTSAPTDSLTSAPTDSLTSAPTDSLTSAPTDSLTSAPTDSLTSAPTDSLTSATTDSLTSATTDSLTPESTDSSNLETTEATDSTHSQAADSLTPETPLKTTDAPKTQITDVAKTDKIDLPETQTQIKDSAMMRLHPEMRTRQKGKLDTCEGYKDLDSCRYQIPALRHKFGLHNAEHTTMYHCNCTARLAKELAGEDEVDKVHFWLLDFVSRSCFVLPWNCTGTASCSSSSSSSSNDAPLIERWRKGAALWRHLAAPRRKGKRFNNKRSKRKGSTIRLHNKCLRMYSKLHTPKTFNRKEMQQLSNK